MNKSMKYCGYIVVVGRPNVGKSTLMNRIIGQKISITSRKPQTTRHRITGVRTDENTQYIFLDTPGFQKKVLTPMNEAMNQSVLRTLNKVDVILWVIDAQSWTPGDAAFLEYLADRKNVIVCWNKTDRINNDEYFFKKRQDDLRQALPAAVQLEVSAKHDQGIEALLVAIQSRIPEGDWLFEHDQLTDRDMRFLSSEIIREKLFRYLGDELPYDCFVEIDSFKEEKNITKIDATIYVDKLGQKSIVIGSGGDKLKKIGTEARIDIEHLTQGKVFLRLWVKVKESWSSRAKFLKSLDA